MALPILDGNQSATTLSTILAGGEHTPAHTVVSLGSIAISNITSAVSGSVVSISNFPATQPISGTVTVGASSVTFNSNVAKRSDGSWQPLSVESGSNYVNARVYSPSAEVFSATVTVGNSVTIGSLPAISGSVTVGNSVTIGAIIGPAGGSCLKGISGSGDAVRSLLFSRDSQGNYGEIQGSGVNVFNLPVYGTVTVGNSVTIDSLPAISGTVTVGNSVTIGSIPSISGTVTANLTGIQSLGARLDIVPPVVASIPVGIYTTSIQNYSTSKFVIPTQITNTSGVIDSTNPLAISGTVTVGAVPSGSLTTRFGTPTTASVAFATTAVTNANRKYLLIQNVTTGSNVITVGVGFTPTTTQGIQLTAGAGITFESSYIPTGAVYVLSSVTASNFTILEA